MLHHYIALYRELWSGSDRDNQIFQSDGDFRRRNNQPDSFAERTLYKTLDFFRQMHETTLVSWAYLRALSLRVTGIAYWQKSFWSNMIYGGHDMAYDYYKHSVAQEYTLYRRELLRIILEEAYQGECRARSLVQYLENAEAWALGAQATGASLQHLEVLRFIVSKLSGCNLSSCPFALTLSFAQELIQADLLEYFLQIPSEHLRHLVENPEFSGEVFSQDQQVFLVYCLSATNEAQFLTRCLPRVGQYYQQHLFAIEALLEQNSLTKERLDYHLTAMHSAQRWLTDAFYMASRHLEKGAQRESRPLLKACLKDGLFFEISLEESQKDLTSDKVNSLEQDFFDLSQHKRILKGSEQCTDISPPLEDIRFIQFSPCLFQNCDIKSLPVVNLRDIDLQYAKFAPHSQAVADAMLQIIVAHHQYDEVPQIRRDITLSDERNMVDAGSQSLSNTYHSPCQNHQKKKDFLRRFCSHYVFDPTYPNINTFAQVIDIIDPRLGLRVLDLLEQFPDVDKLEKLSSFLQYVHNCPTDGSQCMQYQILRQELDDRNERLRLGLFKQ